MHAPRWEAGAVLLPNGNVLVAGGASLISFVGIRGAEVYDPTNESWVATGSMLNERRGFTLTVLPNGTVLAAGGFGTNLTVFTAELYDPASGTWTSTGSLQTRRGSHTATLLPDGKVLVAGGTSLTSVQASTIPLDPVLASAEIYDLTTGTWTPTSSMGQPRQHHTATLLANGKVLVAGGDNYFGGVLPTTAEVYDPDTGQWSPTLPLVSGRREHIAALLPNGKVLVAGGFNTSDTGPSAELYDPASALEPAPFLLSQPTKPQTGAFQFTFRNTPGLSFTVLSAMNAAAHLDDWTSVGSATEVSPGHYQFTDASPDGRQRFHVVRSP
jgi:WD40 repeat protein